MNIPDLIIGHATEEAATSHGELTGIQDISASVMVLDE